MHNVQTCQHGGHALIDTIKAGAAHPFYSQHMRHPFHSENRAQGAQQAMNMSNSETRKSTSTISAPVFFTSAGILISLAILVTLFQKGAQTAFGAVQGWIVTNAGWFYILVVALILLTAVYCMLSRYGNIKLGPDHSEPDYSGMTWFSMLFCAGMGIGLMFFGVAEPLMHTLQPPVGEPETVAAAREAMKITFFHWGLHAWAIYAIVALTLAFFSFRHGLPLTLRSALYPLIGERIYGPIGHAVDIFAVVSTVLGIATSLGFGVLQINSGLNYLIGIPVGIGPQIILIIIASALATMSVMAGLDKGIRRLSEFNMILAVLLLLTILIMGPTVFLIQAFVQNTGSYLSEIVNKTFNLYAYERTDWLGGWTLFYWGWWLSWSPFVGMFIARVSRGRTIREFIIGVTLIPSGFTFLWMTVFGDTAIALVLGRGLRSLAETTQRDNSLALFEFLAQFPFSQFLSIIAVIMVVVFFVTSADSGALVIDMLASGGREDTPAWQRLFWSLGMGVMAIALLLADGLQALQTATIASALPFSIVLVAVIWGLLRALQMDVTKSDTHHQLHLAPHPAPPNEDWRKRVRNLMTFPTYAEAQNFLLNTVTPACEEVATALRLEGATVNVVKDKDRAGIEVMLGDEVDFIYQVRPRGNRLPAFVMKSAAHAADDEHEYYRAEVYLSEGGQNYDVMGWSRQGIIADILDQYGRHLHFLHLVR